MKLEKSPRHITLIEPTWDKHIHVPNNLGMLRIMHLAYPEADISYVGGAEQITQIKALGPKEVIDKTSFYKFQPHQDTDTMPWNVAATLWKLRKLPAGLVRDADLLVFCSITATMASAVTLAGLAHKSIAFLHGNANELSGWRSRNPARQAFDLNSSLRRFCKAGGQVLVLEAPIADQLSQQHPWIASHIAYLPHPLIPEEACTGSNIHNEMVTAPIRIGFAGNASLAKGFAQFMEVVAYAAQHFPGKFEFHSIGLIPKESSQFDTRLLSSVSGNNLPRQQYVERLQRMHYVFTWHLESYYNAAASGVVYDAINMGIPLLSRRRQQFVNWRNAGYDFVNEFDSTDEVLGFLEALDPSTMRPHHLMQKSALARLRGDMSLENLAENMRRLNMTAATV